MKYLIYLSITLLMPHCGNNEKSAAHLFEGTYVSFSEGAWSKAWDTVVVRQYGKSSFTLEHRTGYQKIGDTGEKKWKRLALLGVLDAARGQIIEGKRGRVYTPSLSGDELLVGSLRYKKIK